MLCERSFRAQNEIGSPQPSYYIIMILGHKIIRLLLDSSVSNVEELGDLSCMQV